MHTSAITMTVLLTVLSLVYISTCLPSVSMANVFRNQAAFSLSSPYNWKFDEQGRVYELLNHDDINGRSQNDLPSERLYPCSDDLSKGVYTIRSGQSIQSTRMLGVGSLAIVESTDIQHLKQTWELQPQESLTVMNPSKVMSTVRTFALNAMEEKQLFAYLGAMEYEWSEGLIDLAVSVFKLERRQKFVPWCPLKSEDGPYNKRPKYQRVYLQVANSNMWVFTSNHVIQYQEQSTHVSQEFRPPSMGGAEAYSEFRFDTSIG